MNADITGPGVSCIAAPGPVSVFLRLGRLAFFRQLVLLAVRRDNIGVLQQLYRAAAPVLDILPAQRGALLLLGGGQLPLLCKMRKLVYAVKLFLCLALPSSSIVPSSSSVSS